MSAKIRLSRPADTPFLPAVPHDAAVVVLAGIPRDAQEQIRRSLVDSGLIVTPVAATPSAESPPAGIARRIERALQAHIDASGADTVIFAVQDEQAARAAAVLEFPLLKIVVPKREVLVQGQPAPLSKGEFDILWVLASQPGHVLSREELATRSRGRDYPVTARAIDVQITEIRRKLGVARTHVQTVRGVGYRFDADPPAPDQTVRQGTILE